MWKKRNFLRYKDCGGVQLLSTSLIVKVLYELLGSDKAESILNPKIEEPTKKTEEKEEQQDVRKLPTGNFVSLFWIMN